MGTMRYGGVAVMFDDAVLAHLQIVVVQRFRQGEGVLLNWLDALGDGDGRSALWMTPALPVVFDLPGRRLHDIDPGWLRRLAVAAATPSGLTVQDRDGRPVRATGTAAPR